jgi:hypothetical protein
MGERRETGGREGPGARRLRLIRAAAGGDKPPVFAQRVGMTVTQLSNYENGIPISKNAAIRMANRIPGLTTDYILRGVESGLSVDFQRRLREAEESQKHSKKGAK